MKAKKTAQKVGLYAVAACIAFYSLFPFYWAVNSSLKSSSELFSPSFIPLSPQFESYLKIFEDQPFGQNIVNSVFIATLTVTISLATGMLAAYGLGRVNFTGRKALMVTFLCVSMFPQIALLSGLFELIKVLNLYSNPVGLSLAYLIFTLPFSVWVLTSFVKDIPKGIEEAAIIDGASPPVIVFRIFIPLMKPAFVTTGLLAFIAAWNEFLFALTLTLSDDARTVPVAIALMSGASVHELPWANIMAASVVVTLPLVALVLIFQNKIVSGLTSGALKG